MARESKKAAQELIVPEEEYTDHLASASISKHIRY